MGSAARSGKDDKSLLWSFGKPQRSKHGQTPYKVRVNNTARYTIRSTVRKTYKNTSRYSVRNTFISCKYLHILEYACICMYLYVYVCICMYILVFGQTDFVLSGGTVPLRRIRVQHLSADMWQIITSDRTHRELSYGRWESSLFQRRTKR